MPESSTEEVPWDWRWCYVPDGWQPGWQPLPTVRPGDEVPSTADHDLAGMYLDPSSYTGESNVGTYPHSAWLDAHTWDPQAESWHPVDDRVGNAWHGFPVWGGNSTWQGQHAGLGGLGNDTISGGQALWQLPATPARVRFSVPDSASLASNSESLRNASPTSSASWTDDDEYLPWRRERLTRKKRAAMSHAIAKIKQKAKGWYARCIPETNEVGSHDGQTSPENSAASTLRNPSVSPPAPDRSTSPSKLSPVATRFHLENVERETPTRPSLPCRLQDFVSEEDIRALFDFEFEDDEADQEDNA
nr:hypothetical protein CFP56_74980 [Quercus suber]